MKKTLYIWPISHEPNTILYDYMEKKNCWLKIYWLNVNSVDKLLILLQALIKNLSNNDMVERNWLLYGAVWWYCIMKQPSSHRIQVRLKIESYFSIVSIMRHFLQSVWQNQDIFVLFILSSKTLVSSSWIVELYSIHFLSPMPSLHHNLSLRKQSHWTSHTNSTIARI